MSSRRRAFTLVELLVVIGIIAVLISILLPTLSKARQNAMRVKCAAQLRQVGVATVIYANNYKGAIPPMHLENDATLATSGWDLKANQQYVWVLGYNGGTTNAVTDPGANIARLIRTKCLGGDTADWLSSPLTYCPAADKTGSLSNDYHQNYNYNIHVKYTNGGSKMARWWTKLSRYGRVPEGPVNAMSAQGVVDPAHTFTHMPYALASDPIFDLANSTHAMRNGRAWNLVYADGSVRTAVLDSRTGRATGNWPRFNDLLNYIERVADGQEVHSPPNFSTTESSWFLVEP